MQWRTQTRRVEGIRPCPSVLLYPVFLPWVVELALAPGSGTWADQEPLDTLGLSRKQNKQNKPICRKIPESSHPSENPEEAGLYNLALSLRLYASGLPLGLQLWSCLFQVPLSVHSVIKDSTTGGFSPLVSPRERKWCSQVSVSWHPLHFQPNCGLPWGLKAENCWLPYPLAFHFAAPAFKDYI